jgi:phytol kinase
MFSNNWIALLVTFGVAILWLRVNNYAAQRGWISSQLSRKIIHMGTGLFFVLCWPLFTGSPSSPYFAAFVPLVITLQFLLVGTGLIKDQAAVESMTRTGDHREILRGPLYYGIVFVLLTVLYWYVTPTGIVALMLMSGGDGLADILGRRYGRIPLPWNKEKTLIGSLGMLLGGWLFVAGVLAVYIYLGLFPSPWSSYLPGITWIALAGTLVESLPFRDVDNLTIPLAAILLAPLLF